MTTPAYNADPESFLARADIVAYLKSRIRALAIDAHDAATILAELPDPAGCTVADLADYLEGQGYPNLAAELLTPVEAPALTPTPAPTDATPYACDWPLYLAFHRGDGARCEVAETTHGCPENHDYVRVTNISVIAPESR